MRADPSREMNEPPHSGRVALIGAGYWGAKLLRNLAALLNPEQLMVIESDLDRLALVARNYPALSISTELDDVFADESITAVLLATPANTHHRLARRALEAHRHVFVEKPLAHSSVDASDLVSLAAEVDRVLMVGHTFLFSPRVEWLYNYVNSNRMGAIHYAASSRLNLGIHQSDTNVIWDLGPHDLSIIFHLLDEFPLSVQSTARGMVTDAQPEVAFIHMAFPSGAIASVNLSWLAPRKVRQLTLVGAQSMVVYEDTNADEPIKVHDKGVEVPDSPDWGRHQLTYRYGDTIAPNISVDEPLVLELQHFLSCVTTGARPLSDGVFGLGVVMALEAADRSWRMGGGPVEIAESSLIPAMPGSHLRWKVSSCSARWSGWPMR